MAEFPASAELPQLLAHCDVSAAEIVALGELLAHFHPGGRGALDRPAAVLDKQLREIQPFAASEQGAAVEKLVA
jgi:hypothetical protein